MRNWFLEKLAGVIVKKPVAILIAAIILTIGSLWYSSAHLELNTDQDDLVSEKLEYHKRYKDFLRNFGDLEYIYVVVEVENNIAEAKEFTRSLAQKLTKIDDIQEVVYQVSNPALEKSFLLYLTDSQLKHLQAFLTKGPTSIKNIAKWNSLADIVGALNHIMETPGPEAEQEEMRSGFHFLTELIEGMGKTLKTGKAYKPELAGAFLGTGQAIDEEGFLLTPNGKLLFTLIMPKKSYATLSVIEKPLGEIRSAIEIARKEFPTVKAGLTGRPILQADEMTVTNRDMTRATLLAILAVTILFVAYFRRLTRPIMAIIALIFGISWTLGLATIVIGYLNLLSTVFAVILVGAGIEFGLQIVSRYREELAEHKDPTLAVKVCVTKTGRGNITAALTTAAAFYMALFTSFKALSELGFIAGSGILLCLASLLIVLPTMMYLRDRGRPKDALKTRLLLDLTGIDNLYKKPWLIIALLAVITIVGLPGLAKLKFDHNLLNLQSEGLESVEYEKIIIDKSDESTWYAVSMTKTKEESVRIATEMQQFGTVGKTETIETIVPPYQEEKKKEIATLKGAFSGVSFARPVDVVDKNVLLQKLKTMLANLNRLTDMAFGAGYVEAVEELGSLSEKIDSIYKDLSKAPADKLAALNRFQMLFVESFQGGIKMLEDGLNPGNITINDLPEALQGRYQGKDGTFATYTYPKYNIWEPAKMLEFITDVRSVDPNIAGTPVEVYESGRLMQSSFQRAAIYALFIIAILVLIDFRRPLYALLSLTPLFASILWLLEVMGWAGIQFNLANFFAIPILLGVGVDNGVQIVHRYLQEGKNVGIMSKSTGAAVLLTSLTTGVSFGMLLLSQHRGIQSLGLIMVLGALTALIGSMLLLPAILRLLPKNKK